MVPFPFWYSDVALFRFKLHTVHLPGSLDAQPLGVTVPAIGHWLEILESTGEIIVVPPYFENLGKRLIKSPKVYSGDSGLACYLLGIRSWAELERSPFLGPLF